MAKWSNRRWEILVSPDVERWFKGLAAEDRRRLSGVFDALQRNGPALGRPIVDSVKGSRHHNMKELRSGDIRVLFAFDPHRRAVMLDGGSKRGNWKGWYKQSIRRADRLFSEHLRSLGRGEGPGWGSSRDAGR